MSPARSSRKRYEEFVEDYKHRRLDEKVDEDGAAPLAPKPPRRREFLREYVRWLRPHRYALGAVFLLALIVAGLQMIEPLFMRFIIDRVILNNKLNLPARLTRLNVTGIVFLTVIILSHVGGAFKDYRQRILNVRVMLSLRRALYDRLLLFTPSPVVRLNRAVATRFVIGPQAALDEVEPLAGDLGDYRLFHAVRAELLAGLGRHEQASLANERALALAANPAERELLARRLAL